jgi:hypothetical protein
VNKIDWYDIIGLFFGLVVIGDLWYIIPMGGVYIHPFISFVILVISIIGFSVFDKLSS